jgi:signal transduction histidine kinase
MSGTSYQDMALVYRMAGEAMADPRTVIRFLNGEKIRGGLLEERLRKALARTRAADAGGKDG